MWITSADFASRVKRSRGAISIAIKEERIPAEFVERRDNRVMIKYPEARRALLENSTRGKAVQELAAEEAAAEIDDPGFCWGAGSSKPEQDDSPPARKSATPTTGKQESSTSKRLHWQAEIVRMKAEEMAGRLIDGREMEAVLYSHIRQARDGILSMVPRVIDGICAIAGSLDATQRHQVEVALMEEIGKVLEALADTPVAVKPKDTDADEQ